MSDRILMTPEMAMQFLIWSYYYHSIIPNKNISYHQTGLFSDLDARKMDEIKDIYFDTYEDTQTKRICAQFDLAKIKGEPCPYSQKDLDSIFAYEINN